MEALAALNLQHFGPEQMHLHSNNASTARPSVHVAPSTPPQPTGPHLRLLVRQVLPSDEPHDGHIDVGHQKVVEAERPEEAVRACQAGGLGYHVRHTLRKRSGGEGDSGAGRVCEGRANE
eukprot:205430-Chlamydomonas_euryale.AAC.6